ncbi:MAG: proline dehydrogenase family protein [Planctomycetales bacterium]|nr:proline dehydrogenase family protein [Planctomycetales bacterium]
MPELSSPLVADQVAAILADFHADPASSAPRDVQQAVFLAAELQRRAGELQTPAERRQQAELDRMIGAPDDKATLMQMTDQAFRARLPQRAADQLIHILDVQGVPRFFSTLDRTLLRGFQSFGGYLPGVAMPLVKEKMREETANVVLPAEQELLAEHLHERRREGVRMNVNFLGEALLGEREAQRRLQSYLQALARPEIEVISVKISTIYSQIAPLARRHTVEVLCDRLELLFRAAAKNRFTRADGTVVAKFVYLDMEEYRDKEITAAAFMATLDRPGLEQVRAGIALQAYVPDSFVTQRQLTEWARRRVVAGRAPITIRLVKGANMEMERVEASVRGWPLATYSDKADTDANFHRMLAYGMRGENIEAVHLGVASHNLFSLAYGLVLAHEFGQFERVQFEMLEGMANHQRRALFSVAKNLLLYAPACRQEEFINAIGYLVRRLDENTGPDNFLRHAFSLSVGSDEWEHFQRGFVASFARFASAAESPRRTQDRALEEQCDVKSEQPTAPGASQGSAAATTAESTDDASGPGFAFRDFANEPDTDWALSANGEWGEAIVARWRERCDARAADVPLVIAGEALSEGRETNPSHDPSRPGTVVANFQLAAPDDAERAVQCAAADPSGWRRMPPSERTSMLHRVADVIAARRGDLLGAMLAEGGKTLAEGDPEVSEAIDFCRFYALAAEQFAALPTLRARGKGVVVVVSPWNFPLAIPCGGVAAALAAGNTVILKPASDTVLTAFALCECFWAAGVPREALQFVPCRGGTVGQQLASHPAVDAVILTGGTATALAMLDACPTMELLAETGGKNATIVTALADRDLAIKNVLHSAFGHSGQKCSATSLLILEEEVYRDAAFRTTLCDAVESLTVGSAWDLPTKVGPLIRPPAGELERGLKELEPGESWAVMPRLHVSDNPHLVSPGVKWGVGPHSFTHGTEFFGPLLGVMSARNLHEAIDLVNATGYGLTSGLESLDDREQQLWQEGVCAGNLYINRSTTGAIVLRQPFGGMGKSAFGPGIKAGGPNYVAPLMEFEPVSHDHGGGTRATHRAEPPRASAVISVADVDLRPTLTGSLALPHESFSARRGQLESLRAALDEGFAANKLMAELREPLGAAMDNFLQWCAVEFDATHDHFRLVGEDNDRRYLPVANLWIRIHPRDTAWDVAARVVAARAAGCRVVVSSPPELDHPAVELLDNVTGDWAGAIEFVEETDQQIVELLGHSGDVDDGPYAASPISRLRYAAPGRVPAAVRQAATQAFVYVADAPVLPEGRVELLWYFQEQSLAHMYHRYGNLGRRSSEQRAPVQ